MLQNIDTKKLKLLAQASKGIAQTCCEQERSGLRYSNENLSLLWRCAQDWDAMLYLRKEHARNLRYKNGDQWCDKVPDPENPGKMIREDALISRSGKIPLKHNYLQQYIRNIHGQLLSSPTQTVVYARSKDDQPLGEMLTNALQSCHQLNKVRKLDINVVEELCLTGLACAKVRFDYWSTKNRTDGKIDLVNINRLFFNKDIEDPRLNDIRRIGEIARSTAQTYCGTAELFVNADVPVEYNDPALYADAKRYIGESTKADMVEEVQMTGSDDFAFITEQIPAVNAFLGAQVSAHTGACYPAHHPKVLFEEDVLPYAAAAYASVADRWLQEYCL